MENYGKGEQSAQESDVGRGVLIPLQKYPFLLF
jgi:hypothetical protein